MAELLASCRVKHLSDLLVDGGLTRQEKSGVWRLLPKTPLYFSS
jgi:hypothetical protein